MRDAGETQENCPSRPPRGLRARVHPTSRALIPNWTNYGASELRNPSWRNTRRAPIAVGRFWRVCFAEIQPGETLVVVRTLDRPGPIGQPPARCH